MKLKKPQKMQLQFKICIIFFSLIGFHSFSQNKTKKLNFGISSGINYNDFHPGDNYIVEKTKNRYTFNYGGLLSYKFEKIISIEAGVFYTKQEVCPDDFLVERRTNAFLYNDKLYTVIGERNFMDGKVTASSIIIPARLKFLLTQKSKAKFSLIFGLHRQDNYKYKEFGKIEAEILDIKKQYPNLENDAIQYLKERFLNAENLKSSDLSKNYKTNNFGFLIAANLDLKNITIELNKHINEIRPDNGPVYNFNFSSLNLRYWF